MWNANFGSFANLTSRSGSIGERPYIIDDRCTDTYVRDVYKVYYSSNDGKVKCDPVAICYDIFIYI